MFCYTILMPDVQPGIYRHFKNRLYRVIGTAKHSETQEQFVVYEHIDGEKKGSLWIRPKAMFLETVTRDGKTMPRFMYLPENSKSEKTN